MRMGLVAALLMALAGCVPPPGATSVTYAYNEPDRAYYRPRPAYYYAPPPPRYYAPYYPPRRVIVAPPPGRPYWDRPGYGPRPGRWDDDHRRPPHGEVRPGRPNDGRPNDGRPQNGRPQDGRPQRGGPGGFGPRP